MSLPSRTLSFDSAKALFTGRYTLDHVPAWAFLPRQDGRYHAPQYVSDTQWYVRTSFHGEHPLATRDSCCSRHPSWPLGEYLTAPPLSEVAGYPAPFSADMGPLNAQTGQYPAIVYAADSTRVCLVKSVELAALICGAVNAACAGRLAVPADTRVPRPEFVLSRADQIGRLTGGSRVCGMEGCTGRRLGVRWQDGRMTWPCSKSLLETGDPRTLKLSGQWI